MAISLIAQRYAKAIFGLSLEMNVVEEVKSDMELIHSVCSSNKDFILLLKSPVIRPDKKLKVVEAVFKEKISELRNPNEWIGTEYLVYLSDQFDVNIVVIDASTGFPYVTADPAYIKATRQTIFLLAVNENHYECIAMQIKGGGKRARITCKYETDGDVAQLVFDLLYKDIAYEKHPRLAAVMYGEKEVYSSNDDDRLVYSDSDSDSD